MRVRFIDVLRGSRILERNDGATARAVVPGSRLVNTLLDLPDARKNIARFSGTIQSGSPPGALLAYMALPAPSSWFLLISLSDLRFLWHLTTRMLGLTRIEPATLEDLPSLAQLLMDLFAQESDFRPDYNSQIRGLRLILEQPSRGRVLVLRSATQIIGMINLLFTISTAEGGFVILLEDLIIHKDFRGQGFGGELLKHAIEYAKQKDFLRITLLTERAGEEALAFFEKHGFQRSAMVPMRLWLGTAATAHEKQL